MRSMIRDKVSPRNSHEKFRDPDTTQFDIFMFPVLPYTTTSMNAIVAAIAESSIAKTVTNCATRSNCVFLFQFVRVPINITKPASKLPTRGKKTAVKYIIFLLSALHHVNIFYSYTAAISKIDNQNCQPNCRLTCCDG